MQLLGLEESNYSDDLAGRQEIIQVEFPIAKWDAGV